MNKKIVISLATIAVIGAAAVGGTIAYFSDVEKSTGNIIVTGNIDLTVDHTRQTYNGVDCKTCDVEVVSDTTNKVIERNGEALEPTFAVEAWEHANWIDEDVFDPDGGAKWIWVTNPTTSPADTQNTVSYTFQKKFQWMGPISGATLDFSLATDNQYVVYLNDNLIRQDLSENNFATADHIASIDPAYFNQGTNTLKFVVTNMGLANGTSTSNPAGLIYKLTIDGNCEDSYFAAHCNLWTAKNLTTQKFFNFDDIKPGDWGTNVISLHVHNNPAWACMSVDADETTDMVVGNGINVKLWRDGNCDGIWNDGELSLLGAAVEQVSLNSIINEGLFDASIGEQLPPDSEQCIGLTWCAGSFVGGNCDASVMGNEAQGKTYKADMILEAIQTRHNDGYICSEHTSTEPDLENPI